MWKKVFVHVHEGFAVEVNKDWRQKRSVYSAKFGVMRNDNVLPFVDPEKFTTDHFLALAFAASDFIKTDRFAEAEQEHKRVLALAGKGNNRNPQANTGLSRFKKKKEANANG